MRRGTGLRIEQVIDNTSSRAIAAHERVGFTAKWLALGFAKTQRGEKLEDAIRLYLDVYNANPQPFV